VGTVGDNGPARGDFAAVAAHDARDAMAVAAERLRGEARHEVDAQRAHLVEQRHVERPPEAYDGGGRFAAGEDGLASAGGHQPQAGDAVRVRRDRVPDAELAQCADPARRQAAAAGLVTREVRTVEQDDVADAELAQTQRRRHARRPGADGGHGRTFHDRTPRRAPPA
jgi:hypothetical protein